jgi:DNA (cytosine-5)-methyltransferase 1
MMRYLSICSGIEAASIAWQPLGMRAAAFAEIDKFASAVLSFRHPDVPNLGDFTQIGADQIGPVDILVGGTPCQSFSVAGLRGGLADGRGNLALEFLKLAQRIRPRWMVWENVPGVLSSNGGRDFGAILGGMVECGYGFAYRVLDAQYFGLAQRRKRVFVVGYLGDWRPAAAVLFEREGLSGHPAPSRQAWQNVTGTLGSRATAGGGLGTDFDLAGGVQVAGTLGQRTCDHTSGMKSESDFVVAHTLNAKGGAGRIDAESETFISHALTAARGAACSHDPTMETFVTHALRAEGFDASEDGTGRGTPLTPAIFGAGVRRLTPRECERLQGFPDDYTLIPYRGKPAADGPRYRALGNSMAVPCMAWIGEGIMKAEAIVRANYAAQIHNPIPESFDLFGEVA